MPSTLDTVLDTLSAAITARLQTIVPQTDAQGLILAAKAVEALRGSTTLQGIVAAGGNAIEQVADAVLAAVSTSQAAITASQANAIAALQNSYTGLLTALSTAQDAVAPRVGDILLRIVPNPAQPPAGLWVLDGSVKAAALCPALITAWFPGGTACTMIANYNAQNPYGATVQVVGGNLTLPNMLGAFFRASPAADHGKYFPDRLGGGATTDLLAIGGGTASTYKLSDATGTGASVGTLDAASETTPKYFAALPFVRFA